MKSFTKISAKFVLFALLLLIAAAHADAQQQQDARLRFDKLDAMEARAADVVEVNIDGKLLDLAKRVMMKNDDADAKKIAAAISGLKGIYVRVFNFDKENQYNPADIDEIRQQLQAPGWERLANVRSKKNNQKIDVFTRFDGDRMSGAAILISDAKSVALVNVVGPFDIDMLAEIGGHLNIPKIDIEKENKIKQ